MPSFTKRKGNGGNSDMAMPTFSRSGLNSRHTAQNDQVQLRVDPIEGDLDEEITGLHSKVANLKNIAQVIGSEAKVQNDIIQQLEVTMTRAQAGVKRAMRRLNKSIVQRGSNHVVHVIIFALILFSVLYFWSKIRK